MAESLERIELASTRAAMLKGVPFIDKQVQALEEAVNSNAGYAFDLAKTLVESVCKAILKERNIAFSEKDDMPKLFKQVVGEVPLVPKGAIKNSEVELSIKKTVNGLSTALLGVCELRNKCGFASHGSGDLRPEMDRAQALLAAQTADTIIGFLFEAHMSDQINKESKEILYNKEEALNDWIDNQVEPIDILGCRFLPSEIVFMLDKAAYKDFKMAFESEAAASLNGAYVED